MQSHFIFDEQVGFLHEEELEQLHEGVYFGLGTIPILGGKSVESEIVDVQVLACVDDATTGFDSLAMTFNARQSLSLSPAAIAVHYDADMIGSVLLRDVFAH